MLVFPIVSAQQTWLPVSRSIGPFTVTVSSYTLSADGRGGTVYGSVRSDLWIEIRVLSAYATVTSTEYLGRADLQGGLVLKPHIPASTSVVLSSSYTIEQLANMNTQNVRLHAELRYCVVFGWWCAPIPYFPLPPYTSLRCDYTSCTIIYDRAFTLAEIGQLAQQYG